MKNVSSVFLGGLLVCSFSLVFSQTLSLDKTVYQKGEAIHISFQRADSIPSKAWIGLIPSHISHGYESLNDRNDIVYRFVEDHPEGEMIFYAPSTEEEWDVRYNSNDAGNQEYMSVSFTVDPDSPEPGLEEELRIWNVPALGIGRIEKGKLQEIKVLGALSEGVPAPYNTRFNVASLTKPIVAMLTLTLVSRGNWDLDEPLATYWIDPDVSEDPRRNLLTTRHVLSHQTGFPNWRRDNKLAFRFNPGEGYGYSGEGFEYLREALENKFGTAMEDLADSLLFKPFGMKETRFTWDTELGHTRFAQWHDEGLYTYGVWERDRANAADDLITTVEAYGRFMEEVLAGTGISKEVFSEMISMQVERNPQKGFGLGWELIQGLPNEEYLLSHGGSDRGVQTLALLFPRSQRGLLIFTNGDNGNRLFPKVIKKYYPQLYPELVKKMR